MAGRVTLNVHLQQLAYFQEAARATSWSEAARRLHISQPALSQSLRELERRLEVALFERVGRRQRLTDIGQEMARFVQRVLNQADAFEGRLETLRRGQAGLLRIGMVDAACLYVMPEAIVAFQEQNPKVDLRLSVDASGQNLQKLRSFELDLAIVVGPVDDDDLQAISVAEEPLYIYRRRGSRVRTKDANWLLYPSGSHTRRLIDAAMARAGILPRITIESNNPQVLRKMAAMGFGWSVLPEAVAADERDLEAVNGEPLLRRELVAVSRADAPLDPRVTRLLELARGG